MSWDVGGVRVRRITEVDDWRFAPQDLLPAFEPQDLRRATELFPESTDARTGELVLSIHCYIIDVGQTRIMVDTGNGNHKHRPVLLAHDNFTTNFLERLAAADVEPESVDFVISTHLHPDHCGWNTRLVEDRWVPTFPRARYLFSRLDLEWLERVSVDADPGSVEGDFARMYEDSIRPVLASAGEAVDPPVVLAEHRGTVVRLLPAAGHSAGHSVVEIVSPSGEGLLIVGDAIHHPYQLINDSLSQAGDSDAAEAGRTRRAILREAADRQWTVLTAHFPVGSPEGVTTTDAGALAWSSDAGPSDSVSTAIDTK